MSGKNKTLSAELKEHIPFTLAGAVSGIVLMLVFNRFLADSGHTLFLIFHPLHVVLSAFATTMLYRLRAANSSVLKVIIVGYVGSIGIATISDCVIPYCGERIMGISVPTHSHSHDHSSHKDPQELGEASPDGQHSHTEDCCPNAQHRHIPGKPDIHIGFIEDWASVNAAAILGIALGYFFSIGKLPHASHVLVSTWASMAHIMMNTAKELTAINYIGIFFVLFLAVWLPCCLSDIVFPTLFSLKKIDD